MLSYAVGIGITEPAPGEFLEGSHPHEKQFYIAGKWGGSRGCLHGTTARLRLLYADGSAVVTDNLKITCCRLLYDPWKAC